MVAAKNGAESTCFDTCSVKMHSTDTPFIASDSRLAIINGWTYASARRIMALCVRTRRIRCRVGAKVCKSRVRNDFHLRSRSILYLILALHRRHKVSIYVTIRDIYRGFTSVILKMNRTFGNNEKFRYESKHKFLVPLNEKRKYPRQFYSFSNSYVGSIASNAYLS